VQARRCWLRPLSRRQPKRHPIADGKQAFRSPWDHDECVDVFYLEHLAAPAGIQYLSAAASNEKPAATVSQAGVFLLRRLREAVPTCV
jgi:hypothetical protein